MINGVIMGFFNNVKKIFGKVDEVLKDLNPLYDRIKEAIEDEAISRDELLDLLREVMNVIDKFRAK